MNRADIREILRRRLNDVPGDNWTDSTLNSFIDLAYALILKEIRKTDPEALIFWDYRDTEAGNNWYAKPAGTRGPTEIGLKASASDTDWTPLPRRPYYIARDWTVADNPVYCHRGQYIGIFPAPTATITRGIRFQHVPTDALADDADVPKIETTLHLAIVVWAGIIARGESPESDTKDAAELARLIAGIPGDYANEDQSQPMAFNPNVSDARGRFRTERIRSNGVYER